MGLEVGSGVRSSVQQNLTDPLKYIESSEADFSSFQVSINISQMKYSNIDSITRHRFYPN